jgi:hypothetical protein
MNRASWIVSVLPLLLGPALVQAQETYTIKVKVGGQGVMTIVAKEELTDNRSVITLGDGKTIKQADAKKELVKYRQTIIEQEAGQRPTKLSRVYEQAVTVKPDGKTIIKEEAYHGKTLLIEKKDGKPTFQIEGGAALSAKEAAGLAKEFAKKGDPAQDWELAAPKKPVAVGDSWKIEKKGIKKLIGADEDDETIVADFDKATGTGKLVKAYKKDGKQFGVMQFDVVVPLIKAAQLEFKPGGKVAVKLTADVCIDGSADTGVMRGNMSMKGEATGPMGIVVNFDVTGTIVESTQEVKK